MCSHVANCTLEHRVNKSSAVFSTVFFFNKCAGHFRDGFRSMHHSFRLEFMFAQSFYLQVSFNQTDIDGSRPISFRHLEEMLKHCGNCSDALPSGWSGGRVGRYYLDNKEIRFPLSKLLVPRSLSVPRKTLPLCNEYYSHCDIFLSKPATFVEVEVIFSDSSLYQKVRTFNQFNSEML